MKLRNKSSKSNSYLQERWSFLYQRQGGQAEEGTYEGGKGPVHQFENNQDINQAQDHYSPNDLILNQP